MIQRAHRRRSAACESAHGAGHRRVCGNCAELRLTHCALKRCLFARERYTAANVRWWMLCLVATESAKATASREAKNTPTACAHARTRGKGCLKGVCECVCMHVSCILIKRQNACKMRGTIIPTQRARGNVQRPGKVHTSNPEKTFQLPKSRKHASVSDKEWGQNEPLTHKRKKDWQSKKFRACK